MSRICPNCKKELTVKEGGHFVPPGMGDVGFYFCKPKDKCATCGGTGKVENSTSGYMDGGGAEIDCPTCTVKDNE